MPWAIPAAIIGGSTLAGLFGANKAAGAARQAAQLQSAATDRAAELQFQLGNRALDLQQAQWAQTQQHIAPWIATGTSALGTLGGLAGLSPSPGVPRSAVPPSALAGMAGLNAGGYHQPDMVQMRAPTGQIKLVPRAIAPHYEARGAVVVN